MVLSGAQLYVKHISAQFCTSQTGVRKRWNVLESARLGRQLGIMSGAGALPRARRHAGKL